MQNQVNLVTPTDALLSAINTVWKWIRRILVLILICVSIYTLSYIFNLDLQVVQPDLTGTVTSNGKSISGATITLGTIQTTSNPNGEFKISNLQPAVYDFTVSATGYETATTKIEISKAFLNYHNQVNLEVKKAGVGSALGKIVVQDQPGYIFLDEYILINNKPYSIDPSGNYSLEGVASGEITLELESEKLANTKITLSLNSGQTLKVPDITTFPTGDIKATLLNYLTNQPVPVAQVDIQNVPSNNISINSAGELRIKDLVIERDYLIRISAKEYVTREYNITIKQGVNPLPTLRMVPQGLMALTRADESKGKQLFLTELDGANAKPITNFTNNSNAKIGNVLVANSTVYYLSDQDRVRSTVSSTAALAYKYDSGVTTKLTTNTTDLGTITPNFNCSKLVNYTSAKQASNNVVTKTVQSMDLDGNNRKEVIKLTEGDAGNFKFFANCNGMVYSVVSKGSTNGIYQYSYSSNQNVLITATESTVLSVSSSGNLVLYSTINKANSLTELYVYNISTKQATLINPNIKGTGNYQFLQGSNDSILYLSNLEGETNIYSYSINGNSNVKITTFAGSEQVNQFYQFSNLIFYETNRGLYVMDFNFPVPGVLVTSNFISYTTLQ